MAERIRRAVPRLLRQLDARVPGGAARPLAGHRHDARRSGPARPSSSGRRPAWSPTRCPRQPGEALRPADQIVVNAYLSAYTAGLLAWADGNGERKLEELIDEAFDALQRR